MKKLIYMLICCTIGLPAQAQYYSFSRSVKPYEEISCADVIDTVMENHISFQPNHPFTIFGKSDITSFSVGVATGYLVASNLDYGFALDPMMGTYFRKIPGQSSVSIKEIQTGTDTLLVLQWKQIGLKGHPDNEFLNFQLKLNLRTEQVEFHYGPSNYLRTSNDSAFMSPENSGPEVMVVLLYPDFSNYYEFNALSGNPTNPSYSRNYGRLNNIPVPNQVYTFQKRAGVGISETTKSTNLLVYPNPSLDKKINFTSDKEIKNVKVYSFTGELVMEQMGEKSIELPSSSQLFFVEITLKDGERYIRKVLAP